MSSVTAPSSSAVGLAEGKRDLRGRFALVGLGGVFFVVLVLVAGWRWWTAGDVSTDDAIVDADVVPVAVQVGGQVSSVAVADNTRVALGDPLLTLDTVELEARLDQAKAELDAAVARSDAATAQLQVASAAARGGLSSAQAQVSMSKAQVGSSAAQVSAARAQLARAKADAERARVELDRSGALLAAGVITRQQMDAKQGAADAAEAAVSSASSQVSMAEEARRIAESRVAEAGGSLDANAPIDAKIASAEAGARLAAAGVGTARAALTLAQLAVDRATVLAPADGVVSRFGARVGQILSPGQQIAYLVPEESYIIANFKETQIGEMKPGQPVDIDVDGYPGGAFSGVVESLSAGTGSRFALLAPDNASGNFVKVVQRVPVRIGLTRVAEGYVLRPGQSVVVTVHTD